MISNENPAAGGLGQGVRPHGRQLGVEKDAVDTDACCDTSERCGEAVEHRGRRRQAKQDREERPFVDEQRRLRTPEQSVGIPVAEHPVRHLVAGSGRTDPVEELPRAADQHHQDPQSCPLRHSSAANIVRQSGDGWEALRHNFKGLRRPLQNLAGEPTSLKDTATFVRVR